MKSEDVSRILGDRESLEEHMYERLSRWYGPEECMVDRLVKKSNTLC